jgi:hypothetical protein
MKKTFRWIVALGVSLFILNLSTHVLPEFGCVLMSMLIFLVLVAVLAIALVVGFLRWRRSSKLWPVPALVGVALILCSYYAAPPLGRHIADGIFKKDRADYARVVESFKNGSVRCANACNGDVGPIEATSLPAHISFLWGAHCSGGGVIAILFLDTDEPLLHEGYLFKKYDEDSDCGKRFGVRNFVLPHLPYIRQIQGGWYRISDQPGL